MRPSKENKMTKEYYMVKQQLMIENLERINSAWMTAAMNENRQQMAYYKRKAKEAAAELEAVNSNVFNMMRNA